MAARMQLTATPARTHDQFTQPVSLEPASTRCCRPGPRARDRQANPGIGPALACIHLETTHGRHVAGPHCPWETQAGKAWLAPSPTRSKACMLKAWHACLHLPGGRGRRPSPRPSCTRAPPTCKRHNDPGVVRRSTCRGAPDALAHQLLLQLHVKGLPRVQRVIQVVPIRGLRAAGQQPQGSVTKGQRGSWPTGS